MRWLKWGIPLGLVVVLVAAFGGVVLARQELVPPQHGAPASESGAPGEFKSRSGVVYSADAASYPDHQIIEGLLDNYFDSINRRNYELWRSTVTPEKWDELPKKKWMDAYDTTRDHGMRVNRIESAHDRSALIMLSFTSEQSLDDAPPQIQSRCIRWNVVYPVVLAPTGNAVLDISTLPNSSIAAPC